MIDRPILYLLDAVRTIAALSVVVFHFKNFFATPGIFELENQAAHIKEMLVPSALSHVLFSAPVAIYTFWAISGFVFAHVYGTSRQTSFRNYWVNRFSRLYPLHFLTLCLVALLQYLSQEFVFHRPLIYANNDLHHFVLQLFFISNWGFENGLSFNGPIWSVSVEVAIYAVFFLFLGVSRRGILPIFLMLVLLLGLVALTSSLIPVCGVYFFFGVLSYKISLRVCQMAPRRQIFAAFLIVCLGSAPYFAEKLASVGIPETLQYAPMIAAFLVPLLYLELRLPVHRISWMKPIGNITYSTYLIHTPLQMCILLIIGTGILTPDILPTNGFFIAYVLAVIIVGHFTYRFFEKPAQTGIRRFLKT